MSSEPLPRELAVAACEQRGREIGDGLPMGADADRLADTLGLSRSDIDHLLARARGRLAFENQPAAHPKPTSPPAAYVVGGLALVAVAFFLGRSTAAARPNLVTVVDTPAVVGNPNVVGGPAGNPQMMAAQGTGSFGAAQSVGGTPTFRAAPSFGAAPMAHPEPMTSTLPRVSSPSGIVNDASRRVLGDPWSPALPLKVTGLSEVVPVGFQMMIASGGRSVSAFGSKAGVNIDSLEGDLRNAVSRALDLVKAAPARIGEPSGTGIVRIRIETPFTLPNGRSMAEEAAIPIQVTQDFPNSAAVQEERDRRIDRMVRRIAASARLLRSGGGAPHP